MYRVLSTVWLVLSLLNLYLGKDIGFVGFIILSCMYEIAHHFDKEIKALKERTSETDNLS